MKTTAPLTKTQYGLYVECMEHQGEACYNIPYLYTFDGSLDEQRLQQAIEAVVMAHPTLFTRIELGGDGEPVQTIDDMEVSDFKVQVSSCADVEAEKVKFVKPFLLAKYNNEQQALFSTIHNGRSDKQLAHSVAMLVRTLPLYAKWDDETTVLDFLKACQEQMSGCRQHETYSYSDVVNDLGLQSATMFAWHGSLFDSLTFARLPMQA